ncbi:MAG TPA: hypothetical protein VFU04_08525 [Solirubrobacterales bacterium]|nr:hypothetical protein [Solirubrobacterales bacterium]
MRTYFHSCPADAEPESLLDPAQQFTTPWGAPNHGPCDKCEGAGSVRYECKSCLEDGADSDCPACEGRVHFESVCPACEGGAVIDRTKRRGIAVFPSRAGLYRYLAERDADVRDRVLVELEGELSDDGDLDADAGALLIHPSRVVAVQPFDLELFASIRRHATSVGASAEEPRAPIA